ncbi:hypothetical protein LCGC14_1830160 [marine sediment metagenome]|uniref:Uncharacterized protein n=1 Tax=marine sediment metagenome TaxID=412755 RepID=A0A0F9H4G8_9ZZZZ
MATQESPTEDRAEQVRTVGHADSDHDEYMSHRARLLAGEEYYARSYDKWLLTLSGGALALSMALCKDVLVETPQGTGWLFWSWMFFTVAIAMILGCILLAQFANEKDVKILDRLYPKQEEDWQAQVLQEQEKQLSRKFIGWLNGMSLACFFLGLCLLAYFASRNM